MPTYSEVTITFTNDWVDDDIIGISSRDTSVTPSTAIIADSWTWVTTRSTGFEVTSGTPTANAGETAAINFKTAFDLDFTTGYTTTVQNDNEILIQSETLGEDFLGVLKGISNTGERSVAFSNYVDTPAPGNVASDGMILTTSPHYINSPFVYDSTTKMTLTLYVWDGDITSVPATATETLTKIRPSVNYAEFNTDISRVIKPSLNEVPPYNIAATTQIVDSNADNLKWVYYVASYTDATNSISDQTGYRVAADGYGYYADGINPSFAASEVLTDCANRKVDRTSFVLFPFINSGTITSIDIDTEGGEINATETMAVSNQSTDYIQYISVDLTQTTSDEYLTIVVNPGGSSYVYEIIDECKYTPYTVVFKNRWGVFETVTMFKKSMTTLTTKSEEFVNNYVSAATYDTTVHQYHKLNITGKETIKLNSGYINDSENELYKQLLLSDKVFFYSGGYVPVNVKTSDLEYKTRINDSLVKYSIEFDYAYNTIQNV
jgi:hypothetical protein